MHSHCSRNFSATLPLLQTQNDSALFNIYFQGRQYICFLRMHDVCLDEYQDMAGIFVVEVKTYRKKERRFAFVDIGNGRGWGNSRPVSLSLSGCSKQCLSHDSESDCEVVSATIYITLHYTPYMYILILSHNEINHIINI